MSLEMKANVFDSVDTEGRIVFNSMVLFLKIIGNIFRIFIG